MISAAASRDSISMMRPSMKPCCSRAAWYSAFSDRSPWLRASAIDLITRGRSPDFNRLSSTRSSSAPRSVIGERFMCRPRAAGLPRFAGGDLAVQILQPVDVDLIEMIQRLAGRERGGQRRVVGDASVNRLAADGVGLENGLLG